MVFAAYSLWISSLTVNDPDFAAEFFVCRFLTGIGSGLLNAACLITRASGEKQVNLTAEKHF